MQLLLKINPTPLCIKLWLYLILLFLKGSAIQAQIHGWPTQLQFPKKKENLNFELINECNILLYLGIKKYFMYKINKTAITIMSFKKCYPGLGLILCDFSSQCNIFQYMLIPFHLLMLTLASLKSHDKNMATQVPISHFFKWAYIEEEEIFNPVVNQSGLGWKT